MSKLRTTWNFLCRFRYLMAIVFFVAIVGFLDENSFYNQQLQKEEINALQEEIDALNEQYLTDSKTLNELESDPETIVRIARTRYFMKKPNEDIYVFESK